MSPVKEEDFASSSLIRFVRVRMEVMMPCHSVWPAWILLKSVRTFATRHFGSWIFASTVVPRPRPLTPRGAVVTLTPELLTRWFGLLISLSPLGYLARQRRSCSSYLICGCNMWLLVSTTKASACKLFFFFFPPPLSSPFSGFDTQCLFTPFSPCHGSWYQHTEWLVVLHEWSPQRWDRRRDGDR